MTEFNIDEFNIDDFIKKCDNTTNSMPKIALPPHLKSFQTAHTARAGLTPLGQVIKPEPAHYVGRRSIGTKPSSRPALIKRIRIKK